MKFEPHAYQRRMIRWLLANPASALFARPGSGKTVCVLRALCTLLQSKTVESALVLSPLSVIYTVWAEEVRKWDFAKGLRIEILHGPKKEKALRRPADLYVMNYEGLPWLTRTKWNWPKMFVADESVKLKHARTQRYRHVRAKLPEFDRRVLLSGQPSPNGLMDLWAQLYLLDHGERLEPYLGRFRSRFFTEVGPHQWLPHPDAEKRIADLIGDICLYMDPAEYLELPPLVHTEIPVKIPPGARRAYRDLERAFWVKLDAGDVTAANAAVLSGKLRQLAGGAVYLDGSLHAWEEIHSAKIEALVNRLEESGEPTLVAYEFNHELERIKSEMEHRGYVWRHLAGTPRQRQEAVRLWNACELDVLLGHPASMGHGLNLQTGGRRFVWFGPTWNFDHHDQAMSRIYRQGQQHRVFVDTLVVENSIEQAVVHALGRKSGSQERLLSALKEYRNAERSSK